MRQIDQTESENSSIHVLIYYFPLMKLPIAAELRGIKPDLYP